MPVRWSTGSMRIPDSICATTCRRSARGCCTRGASTRPDSFDRVSARRAPYRIVPDLAIASRGPVASVAIYTTKPIARHPVDCAGHQLANVGGAGQRLVRAAVRDHSRRSSRCAARISRRCSSAAMRRSSSATMRCCSIMRRPTSVPSAEYRVPDREDRSGRSLDDSDRPAVRLCVLGRAAGRAERGRRRGAAAGARRRRRPRRDAIARRYFPDSRRQQAVGARYLRDNIKYYLGDDERAGLDLFYRYAAEAGVVDKRCVLQTLAATA